MTEFDSNAYIAAMRHDKVRVVQIVALYWQHKGYQFTNKLQCESAMGRDLRAAKNLKGYDDEQIQQTMDYLNRNADFKWTLETVHKYVDDMLAHKPKGSGGSQTIG